MNKKKRQGVVYMIIGLSLFLFVVIFSFFSPASTTMIHIGGDTYNLEVLKTSGEREKGLSGRSSLPRDQGLLFVFNELGMYGFWMKEMNFPISIIWLDQNCTVTGFVREALPSSYPEVFYPEKESLFVVEVNPLAQEISIGETLLCDFE